MKKEKLQTTCVRDGIFKKL